MLTATASGVEFRHELTRVAIEGELSPSRRIELNRAALLAVADPPTGEADPAALAHHAEAAGDARAVLRFAPSAGERASRFGAHREAAEQYARAIRFAHGVAPEAQARLYQSLSYENYLTGDFDDAIAASTQALGRYRSSGDALKEGDSLRALSRLLWASGRTREAGETAREAVALLESCPPGHELAMAYAELAASSMGMDDYEGAERWGSRAAELAERLGDHEILASTRVTLGAAAFSAGAPDGRELLERELELALSAGRDEVAARAFNALVRAAMRWRDYAVVDRFLDAGFAYCRDRELGNFRQGLGAERARLFFDRGDWDMATDTADLVLGTARTAGMAPSLPSPSLAWFEPGGAIPTCGRHSIERSRWLSRAENSSASAL